MPDPIKHYTSLDLRYANRIINLLDPTDPQDAATKHYLDLVFPSTMPGDMVVTSSTGGRIVSTQPGEFNVSGSNIGAPAGARVTGLTAGHSIRVRWEQITYYWFSEAYVNTFRAGSSVPVFDGWPTRIRHSTGSWTAYEQTVVLTDGATEVQLYGYGSWNDPANIGLKNVEYFDLNATAPVRLPIGDPGSHLVPLDGEPAWVRPTGKIEIGFNGHGQSPGTGIKTDFVVPYPMRITDWTVVADVAGSAEVDLWRAAYADYPPTIANSVTGTDKPRLSSELKAQSAALTGWVKDWAAGDLVRVNVDLAETLTRATVILSFIRI